MTIDREAIYTVSMVAEMLGVSKCTVDQMRKNGLRSRKPTGKRGKVYIAGNDLYEYLAGDAAKKEA